MRKTISWEGEDKVAGIIFEKGSVKWTDEPVPLTWNFRNDLESVLGHAKDFRREDDGQITAEIVFNKRHPGVKDKESAENDDVAFAILVNEIELVLEGPLRRVSSGNIRSVGMIPASDAGWD